MFLPPQWAASDALTTPFVNIQRILQHLKGGKSCQETRLQSQVLKQSRTIGFLTVSIETFLPCFFAGLDWFEAGEWLNPIKLESRLLMLACKNIDNSSVPRSRQLKEINYTYILHAQRGYA